MTRLSDALKRAATETPGQPSVPLQGDAAASAEWQFAPVETMHVPDPQLQTAVADAGPLPMDLHAHVGEVGAEAPVTQPSAPRVTAVRVGDVERNKLVVGDRVDTDVIEQYRHLAAVLHHAQKSSGVRSVMVTSAMPSEGKTLTASNLALTLSESYQRRVLLIDADLRRPRMREIFALPDTAGLTDSLADPQRASGRLPVHQITPTLWVLAGGRIVPDPMSLLVSPAMRQLIDDAKDSFDWVVVDTPPIAILPDANLLSAMIDTALLVISAESTPYPMVQRAADAIGTHRILGVVLNRAPHSAVPASNYYDYRGSQQRPRSGRRRWLPWPRRSAASGQTHVQ